jgi:hypothetical protein
MTRPLMDLTALLAALDPGLQEGVFAFASLPQGADRPAFETLGTIQEAEGLSIIAREEHLLRAGLPVLFRAAWITLTVPSDLQAVGLTAAVATALTASGISCNVVAGARHDHLFVPVDRAQEALARLWRLQREGS